jgi:chromate reductase
MQVEVYGGLRDLPPYDEDLDTDDRRGRSLAPVPHRSGRRLLARPGVQHARQRSEPGRLGVRPAAESRLLRKPSPSWKRAPSPFGTGRALLALRQCFLWTDCGW